MAQLMIGTKSQPVLISFPTVFEAKQVNADSPTKKFSVQVLLHKENDANIIADVKKVIGEAITESVSKGKLKEAMTKLPKFKLPLRDGDAYADEGLAMGKDREYCRGYMFISATTGEDNPPVVVDRFAKPILNATEVYGGMKAIVTCNFYGYDVKGNMGIAAGLNGLMKREEGERLDGRTSASVFNQFADDKDVEAITSYEQAAGNPEGDLQ